MAVRPLPWLLALAAIGIVWMASRAVVATPTSAGVTDAVESLDDSSAQQPDRSEADRGELTPSAATSEGTVDIPVLDGARTLDGLDGWLQAGGIQALEDLRGRVVVLQFWTFGCFNCKNTIPNLQGLDDRFGGRDDFEIVGVHSPEFAYEKDPDAIAAAAADLGVTWPIALDTDKRNFRAWQGGRAYWPRTYVLDRDGRIRFDHIGEGAYEELNDTVAALLGPA